MEILEVFVNEQNSVFYGLYEDAFQRRCLLEEVLKSLKEMNAPTVTAMSQIASFVGLGGVQLMVRVPASLTLEQVKKAFLEARPKWNPNILLLKGEETEKFEIPL